MPYCVLKAIENILISKKIFTVDEFQEEIKRVTQLIAKSILQKANFPGDLDKLIKEIQDPSNKEPHN